MPENLIGLSDQLDIKCDFCSKILESPHEHMKKKKKTFVEHKRQLNSLSAQRRAAAVSVVKKGFPVPAAKITTLPFSKCLTALRRI